MRSKAIILLAFLFIFGFVPEMSSQGIYIYKKDGSRINVPYENFDSIVPYEVDSTTVNYATVDLGLPSGTMWASHNIGATNPEEYGSYFAWGEIKTKDEYTRETYIHYDTSGNKFISIGDVISGSGYDAAYMTWGDGWRMPTKADFEELRDCCFWTWTTLNGVNGYKVESYNGNSIFLPAAGGFYETPNSVGECCYYWSGTIKEGSALYANYLIAKSYSYKVDYANRHNGYPIRPVKK